MQHGAVEQLGSPRDLYERPASTFVRDFVGQTVILRGRVGARAGDTVTVTLEGGGAIAGRTAPGVELLAGDEAHAAIRPEDIDTAPDDRASPSGNTLTGVIDALLFVGDRYEARVALRGEQRILVLLPRAREWREGQRLRLALPPELVSVWPA